MADPQSGPQTNRSTSSATPIPPAEQASQRRILALWNGKSGNAALRQEVADRLQSLEGLGLDIDQTEPASAEEAADIAAAASEDTVVVAAGGDGTVHAVAQGLLRRHVGEPTSRGADQPERADSRTGPALAILPMGTANDLARSLAIPLDPLDAVESLASPSLRWIDAVHVSAGGYHQWMLNAAAGGNAAEVARRIDGAHKQRWGAWCYVPGVVDVAANLESYRVSLQIDDDPAREVDSFALVVANGRTTATMEVARSASLEDGQFDLVVVKDGPLVRTATVAAEFFTGDYLQHEQVDHRRGQTLRVQSEREISFSIDGELHSARTFRFAIRPVALPVVVGENYVARPQVPNAP